MELPSRIIQVLKHQQQTPGPVNSVRFNSSGQYCMTGGHDKAVRLWNPHTGKLIQTYTGHGWEIHGIAIAKDNTKFSSCGGDKLVYYWDVTTGRILRKFQGHFQRVNCVDFNQEATVLFSGSYDASVRVWDVRSNIRTPIMVLEEGKDSISSIQVTGHEVLTGSVDGGIRIYDIRKGTLTADRIASPVTSVRMSGDGNCILASTLDNAIRLVDKDTGELLNHYSGPLKSSKYKIESTFTNRDSHVISGSEDGQVLIWELVEAQLVGSLKGHSRSVLSLDYHPTEQFLLTASSDGTAILWGPDAATVSLPENLG